MHRTTMGVDADYRNMMKHGMRAALADGWGGSMVATELSDVLFGSPVPLRSRANLGVIEADNVNILVHGHNPLVSVMIYLAVDDREMKRTWRNRRAPRGSTSPVCAVPVTS